MRASWFMPRDLHEAMQIQSEFLRSQFTNASANICGRSAACVLVGEQAQVLIQFAAPHRKPAVHCPN